MNSAAIDSSPPKVAIVLVNWNGWLDSLECLDSLLAQDYADFQVFLVDNESADHSIEHIIAWCSNPIAALTWRRHERVARYTDSHSGLPIPYHLQDSSAGPPQRRTHSERLILIRSGANLGFAGGCNVGIRAAAITPFDYYWILNTDTVVCRDALAALIGRADSEPKPGMTGSTICFYDRPKVVQSLGGARLDASGVSSRLIGTGLPLSSLTDELATAERDMTYVMGASMLVSAAFIRDVGEMQEDYFLYYEEIDWAMRARGKYTLGYAPESLVFHKSGASSSKKMPVFTAKYYYRNRIRFTARYFPNRMGAVRRSLTWSAVRLILKGRWAEAQVVLSILINARNIQAEVQAPGKQVFS